MRRLYTVFISLIIMSYGIFSIALAKETDKEAHFVIVTPDSVIAGEPFLVNIIAKDGNGRIIANYDEIGNDVDITTTGTSTIKPSLVSHSRFKNGIAAVEFIYDKTENFNIIAAESPVPKLKKIEQREKVEVMQLANRPISGYAKPLEKKAIETVNNIEGLLKEKKETIVSEPNKPKENKIKGEASSMQLDKVINNPLITALFFIFIIMIVFVFIIGIRMLWYRETASLSGESIKPELLKGFGKNLDIHLDSNSPISEAYRSLRTNIMSLDIEKPPKTLLIASALPYEGKTTVASNLAIVLAHMGSKVLLVDSCLRRPLIDKIFEIDKVPGLAEILTTGLHWRQAINSTNIENLNIITSGKLTSNPSEILGSARMIEMIEEVKAQFDFILFDSPDAIDVTDAAVLGSRLDGVILVVQSRRTQRETVLRAQSFLENARNRILGYVLTSIETAIPKWFNQYLELLEPKL